MESAATAQEAQCSAQAAGQLLCQNSRLCRCEYFAGGALDAGTGGYRWDCGVFRPRCEAEAAAEVSEAPKSVSEVTPPEVEDEPRPRDGRETADSDSDSDSAPAPAGALDIAVLAGLDADPAAAGSPDSGGSPGVATALSRWGRALLEVPRPERRIGKAPVPRLGDRFAQQEARAEETRIRLEVRIAALKTTLSGERRRIAALEAERDDLEGRRVRLSQQLEEMSEIQQAGLERLTDHTLLDIALFEETVAMAGLKVAALLPGGETDSLETGLGGPFIPGDFPGDSDPVQAAQTSLARLDDQIARWGELQELLRSLPLAAPLEQYRISSGFGPRPDPVNGRASKHLGLDFKAPLRTPVLSTAPGEVVYAGWKGRYGRLIEIDHGYGIRTRYAHLRKIHVKRGQQVGHREEIGLVGSSGRSTGPHVHYEVLVDGKPRDPMNFLKAGIHVFKASGGQASLSGLTLRP